MKIICEHCGTSIDIEKDKVCANCKAPYNKNKQYIEYINAKNKQDESNKQMADNIKKGVFGVFKVQMIIVPIIIIVFLTIFISIFVLIFKDIKKSSNFIEDTTKDIFNSDFFNKEDNYEIIINDVNFSNKVDNNPFLTEKKLKSGYKYAIFDIEFSNMSNDELFIFYTDFDCIVDGYSQPNVNNYFSNYLPTTINKNTKVKGNLVFEVPKGSKTFEIRYKNFSTSITK